MAGQGESASLEGIEQNEIISAVCSHWKTVGEIILPFHCQWPGVTCFAANALSLVHTFSSFLPHIHQVSGGKDSNNFLLDFAIIFMLRSPRKRRPSR